MTSYQRTIYLLTIISIIFQPIQSYVPNLSFSFVVSFITSSWWSSSSLSSTSTSTTRTSFHVSAFAFSKVVNVSRTKGPFVSRKIQVPPTNNFNNPFLFSSITTTTSANDQDEDVITPSSSSSPPPSSSSNAVSFDEYSNQPVPNSIPNPQSLSKLPKLEQEFYSMMKEFSLYTPHEISTNIPNNNPTYQALYYGVLAGSNEPLVMNAFAIIFQDLLPIRIAGRMIYKHLKNVMESGKQKRMEENVFVQNETGLSLEAIENGRRTFMGALNTVTQDVNNEESGSDGGGAGSDGRNEKNEMLTMTELIDSGIVDMVVELMQYDSFDEFVKRMEQDEDEKITFEKFMIGLQKCALMKNNNSNDTSEDGGVLCDISCDLEEVLSVTAQRMAPIDARKKQMTVSQRKQKYSDRYDEMVQTFEEWESIIGQQQQQQQPQPNDNNTGGEKKKAGRMRQVLAGCFAGAKNERIVYALKIVYMDYSALRVGGDLVFKLMKKVVNRKR